MTGDVRRIAGNDGADERQRSASDLDRPAPAGGAPRIVCSVRVRRDRRVVDDKRPAADDGRTTTLGRVPGKGGVIDRRRSLCEDAGAAGTPIVETGREVPTEGARRDNQCVGRICIAEYACTLVAGVPHEGAARDRSGRTA